MSCDAPVLPSFTLCLPHFSVTVDGVCPSTLSSTKIRRPAMVPVVFKRPMPSGTASEGGGTAEATTDAEATGSLLAGGGADALGGALGGAVIVGGATTEVTGGSIATATLGCGGVVASFDAWYRTNPIVPPIPIPMRMTSTI